tara:strand:- start:35 stop:664 length:630 start_codon:yes stop_codon:yes gene_type:complete
MINVILIIILILILVLNNFYEVFADAPCRTDLSDVEYLEHMIPHHQVAVDVSIILQKKTKWPIMKEVIRKLIWVQKYEIELMKQILKTFPEDLTNKNNMSRNYISTISDFLKPNELGLTKTYCDPHFFDPDAHMEHMEHMDLDDDMYIEHMIPHHQVAVDMSKKLLKNTKNDFMIGLAYRIIRSQQDEILLLNDMLKTDKNLRYKSNLI